MILIIKTLKNDLRFLSRHGSLWKNLYTTPLKKRLEVGVRSKELRKENKRDCPEAKI